MRIQSRRKLNKKLLLSLAAVLVISVFSWLYYAYHFQNWPFLPPANKDVPTNTVDYNAPTTDQTAAGTKVKEQTADKANSDPQNTAPTQQPSTVGIDITATNKTSSTLMVRTLIQSVTSTGTCTLTMSGPNGGSYSATAGIQAMASTSTCKGFDVPLAGLAHGSWQVKVDFVDGVNSGTASREVIL